MAEKKIIAIDASTLDSWDMCKKKYELQFIKHLTTSYKSKSLSQGQLIHLMLKNYYTFKKHDANFNFEEVVSQSVLIAYNESFDLSPVEVEEVINVFRGYCKKYENENWTIEEVEKPFAVTLYDSEELQIIGQGISDLIVTSPSGLAIVDHKKRSRREEENSLNNQRYMYTIALGINTFITNKLVFIKDPDRYMRQIDSYDQDQQNEWLEELVMAVKEIIAFKSIGFYRRSSTSCDKFGGCQFKKFCNKTPSRRELMIGREYFEGEVWDVGKVLEEKNNE